MAPHEPAWEGNSIKRITRYLTSHKFTPGTPGPQGVSATNLLLEVSIRDMVN